ncbi:type II toxin-antitoxin system CcdA family antitoxin [Jannaschia marina]|uniref:type II toxin-antitoxin system CcdA family antitoxin n=1 Tax=Jannaschia marina TaxID=2741674 RepID=UPI0015C8833B|nr:type II toxin-antitoxin system CcdA family antitoxin [Jannaschia marina]
MPTRKTSITMDAALLDEAKAYGINVSAAAAAGVAETVRAERHRRLKEKLRPDIEAINEWVERNGLPLEKQRLF